MEPPTKKHKPERPATTQPQPAPRQDNRVATTGELNYSLVDHLQALFGEPGVADLVLEYATERTYCCMRRSLLEVAYSFCDFCEMSACSTCMRYSVHFDQVYRCASCVEDEHHSGFFYSPCCHIFLSYNLGSKYARYYPKLLHCPKCQQRLGCEACCSRSHQNPCDFCGRNRTSHE